MKTNRVLRVIVATVFSLSLCLAPALSNLAPVYAAASTSQTAATDGNVSGLISSVSSANQSTQAPTASQPNLPKAGHSSDFDWGSTQTLHGLYSSSELYFTLPSYWNAKYACIQIEYNVSQLINGVPCSLTFSINGQSFYSCEIVYKNSETQTLYVEIPKNLLKNDTQSSSNHLEVTGYARLYDDQGCIDNNSNANWVTISKNSGVQVGYDLLPYNNRISYYPYPFMSSLNVTGSDTAIEFASSTQDEEVAAGMFIMANLSSKTVNDNAITLGSWSDLKAANYKNRIVIGLTKDMPQELQSYISQYKSQLKGQVLILSVNDTKKQPILIIVSDDADCLMEAGSFLADSDRVSEVRGSSVLIKKGSAQTMADSKKLSTMNVSQYTLQGITGGGLTFTGPFEQTSTVFLPVASDYTLSSTGKISLKFRYSKNLDFQRSMLTVYWGNVPISSKKLSLANADGDELTFTVPSDVVGTNASSMKFSFDLEIPDMICTSRQDNMPWAYVTPDSTLYLPADNDVMLQFDNRPAPFQKDGSLNDVMLVMTDHPTTDELTLLGRAMAVYGAGADAYGNLKVCKASEFSTANANYNIITTGTPATNKLISMLNNDLYFKYNQSGTQFLTNTKLILSDDYAKSIGTLQLLASPYASNRGLLVLTGPTDDSLKQITNLLSNDKLSWNLKNDCVLIDSEGNAKTYRFQNNVLGAKKASLGQVIADNKTSLLFALAGTSVMLVLFLAAVLIIIRAKINKKQQ